MKASSPELMPSIAVPVKLLTVVQLIPALHSGGAERSALEIARALVQAGHRSVVISAGGRLVEQLKAEGSEHVTLDIGRKSLGIVASAADGREPQTALTGAILTAAQVNEVTELVPWGIAATPKELAALAPVVFNVASAGDPRAIALVGLAVEELVLHIRALAVKLFGDDRAAVPVAFSGGLLHKGSFLRKKLEQRLKSAVPGAQVRPVEIIAARGAVKEALSRIATTSSRATTATT